VRRIAGGLAVLVIAVGGVVGILAFLSSHDDSTTGASNGRSAQGPGAASRDAGSLLAAGNVELVYGRRADRAPLRALAQELGPDTPDLRAAGAAVIVRRAPGRRGVLARAWHRTLEASSPRDPRLGDFVQTWLGAGAGG
jgi:hypothetical protein